MDTTLPCRTSPPRPRLWFPTSPPRPRIPVPFRQPPPRPVQPLRIKVSYAKAVTVCIAAIARGDTGSRIVLCCDSRLDHGVFGSTNYAPKVRLVGTGWLAMISGRWQPAQELVKSISNRLQAGATSLSDAVVVAQEAAKDFRASAFFSKQATEDALVTGFVGGDPIILHINGQMLVEPLPFAAIGEGYNIANVMMNQRNYSQNDPVEQVAYIVYEAKRCSEKVGSVGKDTTLAIQHPTDSSAPPNSVNMDMFSHMGLVHLSNMRERYWLKSLHKTPKKFPGKCFVNPKDGPDDY